MSASRYIIGIDLGTTNSALTYIDTHSDDLSIHIFQIEQYSASNEIDKQKTLPSFLYFSLDDNRITQDRLWDKSERPIVGKFSREQSQLLPDRVISSTKSWLCHSKVDRHEKILPWHPTDDLEKLSPVEATTYLLDHMIACWNEKNTDYPLEDQQVVITVPASFDEVARTLTAQAINDANLHQAKLLEEPQAAFYAWLYNNETKWKTILKNHTNVLVCDIGGGTSDFSIIGVNMASEEIMLERVSVGEHLLLGGDNLDLTIAHYVEPKINNGQKLNSKDWGKLINVCRAAKETLLGENAPMEFNIVIAGSGKSLIGAMKSYELKREEIVPILLEGFLPQVDFSQKPLTSAHGFQEFGLPYTSDSAVTKHLAAFLNQVAVDGVSKIEFPTAILFNGGFFESSQLKSKTLAVIESWSEKELEVLSGNQLDLAVAEGAAYFGLSQRGIVGKIKGGLACNTFVGVQDKNKELKAFCIATLGMEEGATVKLNDLSLQLRVNQPVEFPIFTSKGMTQLKVGDAVDLNNLKNATPIRAFLKTGKKKKNKAKDIVVNIEASLTSIGVLEIHCAEVSGDRKWKLEYDLQNFHSSDSISKEVSKAAFSETIIEELKSEIGETFIQKNNPEHKPEGLLKRIERITGQTKWEWDLLSLRKIWELLWEVKENRKVSTQHELRWLNLIGFCLRPGYGVNMDDWRVQQTWGVFLQGVQFPKNPQNNAEWFLLWNRIAGGMSRIQQNELISPYIAAMKAHTNIQQNNSSNQIKGKAKKLQFGSGEKNQFWRLLGNLELIDSKKKKDLCQYLIRELKKFGVKEANNTGVWAIGRIASRNQLYANLNNVLSPKIVGQLMKEIITFDDLTEKDLFSIAQIMAKTNDRYRDVNDQERDDVLDWLKSKNATQEILDTISNGLKNTEQNQAMIFGERLPSGLSLL